MTKTEQMQPWARSLWRAANYHLQRAATRAYRKAIAEGEIEPASECEACGRQGRLHGHHEDYVRPLDVIWLCPLCHSWAHRQRAWFERSLHRLASEVAA